ncbi:hypothetical protein COV93_04680 [Candidatus Woesearchaeota archaeon CG11_big_fil_rev_8_21_14_0_20_43_8]|nr:MAG: hypothetical protein COV93_04680 [Candidatus Woesearchaeota archaeon CG11_big_fil_rev_8_21_14_0_20_43_8]PIO06831.1 MAG: hypothetical protein COT47_02565 [Candidatus Woesearchaeota archaeon CG08_land_8_20_14_0_20_43_7]
MKLFANNVSLRVFVKEGEDKAKIIETLKSLVSLDLTREKLKIKQDTSGCLKLSPITICTIELIKRRHVHMFLESLFSKFTSEQIQKLFDQAESRLDDQCFFFIRLDKERLMGDEYWITDGGDCFHIRISIAAFPAHKERAISVVREMLEFYNTR